MFPDRGYRHVSGRYHTEHMEEPASPIGMCPVLEYEVVRKIVVMLRCNRYRGLHRGEIFTTASQH